MPIAIILAVIDLTLVVHAARTGRFSPWAYVILMIPGFGAVAYILVELIPEWLGSYQGQKARKRFVKAVNPEGRYRVLTDNLAIADTVANREALAIECLALGKFEEAKHHYNEIIARPLGEEPLFFLARALDEIGRTDEAIEEYKALAGYFPGAEARVRYGLLLERLDRHGEAKQVFGDLLTHMRRSPKHVRKAQAEWIGMAERAMRA